MTTTTTTTTTMTTMTILTEENPQLHEVNFILSFLHINAKATAILANTKDLHWDCSFSVTTDNPTVSIILRLVKGHGSFVDYIVYDHANPNEVTSVPILLMESTKTDDSESRNTGINQRFTKFAVARHRFPSTPCVLFFNAEHKPTTSTSSFGRRLLTTFSVKAFDITGKDLLSDAPAFTSVDQLMLAKNSIKEKAGNVSVKIKITASHQYSISAKLSKGTLTTVCHDPNKGLLTGIACAIYSLDPSASFIITEHGVDLTKLRAEPTDKFWYANNVYDLKLAGSSISSLGIKSPSVYWTYETETEKASTILFQNCMEVRGMRIIYHNHSSSARSFFLDSTGKPSAVPKSVTIPDLVFIDEAQKRVYICEGKIKKDILKGVAQLDNLGKFIEYVLKHYPGYAVQRGLCLYLPKLADMATLQPSVKYPIWFALDATGTYVDKLSS